MKGRIRTFKPELFLDEEIWDLAVETGLPVLQGFMGLWCYADREGRFEWRPRALQAVILPYFQGDFSRVLDALWTRGFLVRYAVADREYGLILSFTRHQSINNKEPASVLPDVSSGSERVPDACPTRYNPDLDVPEGKGREGKGTEGEGKRERRAKRPRRALWHRVPADWNPDAKTLESTQALLGARFETELTKFRDWEFKDGKSDADAAWRNWARRACEQPQAGRPAREPFLRQPNHGKSGWEE